MRGLKLNCPRPDLWLESCASLYGGPITPDGELQVTGWGDSIHGTAFDVVAGGPAWPKLIGNRTQRKARLVFDGSVLLRGPAPLGYYSQSNALIACEVEYTPLGSNLVIWELYWDSDNYWKLVSNSDGSISLWQGSTETKLKGLPDGLWYRVICCYTLGGYPYVSCNGRVKKGASGYMAPVSNAPAYMYIGGSHAGAQYFNNIGTIMAWEVTDGTLQPLVERYLLRRYGIHTNYPPPYPALASGIVVAGAGTDGCNGVYAPDGRTCNGYPVYVGPTGEVSMWGYTYTTTMYLAVVGWDGYLYWAIGDNLYPDYGYMYDEFYDNYATLDGDFPASTGWYNYYGDYPAPTVTH